MWGTHRAWKVLPTHSCWLEDGWTDDQQSRGTSKRNFGFSTSSGSILFWVGCRFFNVSEKFIRIYRPLTRSPGWWCHCLWSARHGLAIREIITHLLSLICKRRRWGEVDTLRQFWQGSSHAGDIHQTHHHHMSFNSQAAREYRQQPGHITGLFGKVPSASAGPNIIKMPR